MKTLISVHPTEQHTAAPVALGPNITNGNQFWFIVCAPNTTITDIVVCAADAIGVNPRDLQLQMQRT